MSLNRDSVLSSVIAHRSYPRTAFDSYLILTDKATFEEDYRVYQSSDAFLLDNTHEDLQQVGLVGFAQEPKATTVILAKTDPANESVGALVTRMVELDSILEADFFAVCVVSSHSDDQLLELAKYCETQEMLGIFYTNNPVTITTAKTDLPSRMEDLGLRHSACWYHKDKRLDIAFISRFLGEKIGLVSAKHLVLPLIDASNLTTSEMQNILDKNCNVYDRERKKYIFTKQGTTASNENISFVAGQIFVSVTCIEALYELQLNNSKLSFNSIDLKRVLSALQFQLKKAQDQKIIAEDDPELGASYLIRLNPIRNEDKLEIEIKYLDAGVMKFITLKFTAFRDDTQFNIERSIA